MIYVPLVRSSGEPLVDVTVSAETAVAEHLRPAAQASLFDVVQTASSATWHPSLTRRLRVLLHANPLFSLRHRDGHLEDAKRHYDSMTLAVKILDLIVESTGLEREVNYEVVELALQPLLLAMDQTAGVAPDNSRHEEIVDRVLKSLRNDGDHRRKFQVPYTEINDQLQAVQRTLEFRLVEDRLHPNGGTVLRLSKEAINLFLGAFELDIEDAQTAAEAVVRSQLERGKFHEAVQSARNAHFQSVRLQEKLKELLSETRRDLRRVDWRKEVPKLLDEALVHIEARLITEQNILHTAAERIEQLLDQQARAVAEVIDLIKSCRLRHLDLQQILMGARNVFLDEQARQAFSPVTLGRYPDLMQQVLEPLLAWPAAEVLPIVEAGLPLLCGARPPLLLSLRELLAWQLQPKREVVRGEVPTLEIDPTIYGSEVTRFPEVLREALERRLLAADNSKTLSELLAAAQSAGAPIAHQQLLAMLVLQRFAPDDTEPETLRVERQPGVPLQAMSFYGDELFIHPSAGTEVHDANG